MDPEVTIDEACAVILDRPGSPSAASALARLVHAALTIARRGSDAPRNAPAPSSSQVLAYAAITHPKPDALDRAIERATTELRANPHLVDVLVKCALAEPTRAPAALSVLQGQAPASWMGDDAWDRLRAMGLAQLARVSDTTLTEVLSLVSLGTDRDRVLVQWARGPEALAFARANLVDHERMRTLAELVPVVERGLRPSVIDDVLRGPFNMGRPFQEIAPYLSRTQAALAIEAATDLHPSRYARGLALRSLVPRWAELGEVVSAIRLARSIEDPGERSRALGAVLPFADREVETLTKETLASIAETPSAFDYERTTLTASAAAGLLRQRSVDEVLEFADDGAVRLALAGAAQGEARAGLLIDLADRAAGRPAQLAEFRNELPTESLLPVFRRAVLRFAERGFSSFVTDEYGIGFVEWLPFLAPLGGSAAPAAVAGVF
ncbi:MAG: hypothetical protein AAGE52_24640 [Myxococcota bacterium]